MKSSRSSPIIFKPSGSSLMQSAAGARKKGIEKMNQPCPYVDAKGKKCKGHIVRIEAFKADLAWHRSDEGKWTFSVGEPRTHYHLYCSEKGNHAGFNKPD